MAYHEETQVHTCGKCGAVNHVLVAYAGDSRANERETATCFKCRTEIAAAKCWAIFTAASAEEAVAQLRKVQNRS